MLKALEEAMERRYGLKAEEFDLERIIEKVGELFGMRPEEIKTAGRSEREVAVRSGELLGGERGGDERDTPISFIPFFLTDYSLFCIFNPSQSKFLSLHSLSLTTDLHWQYLAG